MSEPEVRDVIVIPVHNRRETTLACLRRLRDLGDLGWARAIVLDDGSTDGTGAALRAEFPAVEVIQGDGTWWWAGAIRRGMERALAGGAERIFWLNNDCQPPPGALSALRTLIEREDCIAWIDAIAPGGWSYGAHRKAPWKMRRCSPDDEAAGRIDTFSGNCVGLSRSWIERVGLPDDASFPHGLADFDYGLRLKHAGARLQPLRGFVAESADPAAGSSERWLTSLRGMREIWREFSSPRSFLFFPAWRRFSLRHWGPLWGWFVFAKPYVEWAAIALVRALAPGWARARAQRTPIK